MAKIAIGTIEAVIKEAKYAPAIAPITKNSNEANIPITTALHLSTIR